MEYAQVLFLLMLTGATAHAQSVHLGLCPRPPLQQNFNISQFMGTWLEVEKLPAAFELGKCVQASYQLLSDGTVSVHNQEILSNGEINAIDGVARVKDPSDPAHLTVSFFRGPGWPYLVLSTDYASLALIYSCRNFLGLFHVDFAWILSRSPTPSQEAVASLRDQLTAAGVDVTRLSATDQTGCDVTAPPTVARRG